jgi:hypothetical protein
MDLDDYAGIRQFRECLPPELTVTREALDFFLDFADADADADADGDFTATAVFGVMLAAIEPPGASARRDRAEALPGATP